MFWNFVISPKVLLKRKKHFKCLSEFFLILVWLEEHSSHNWETLHRLSRLSMTSPTWLNEYFTSPPRLNEYFNWIYWHNLKKLMYLKEQWYAVLNFAETITIKRWFLWSLGGIQISHKTWCSHKLSAFKKCWHFTTRVVTIHIFSIPCPQWRSWLSKQ